MHRFNKQSFNRIYILEQTSHIDITFYHLYSLNLKESKDCVIDDIYSIHVWTNLNLKNKQLCKHPIYWFNRPIFDIINKIINLDGLN